MSVENAQKKALSSHSEQFNSSTNTAPNPSYTRYLGNVQCSLCPDIPYGRNPMLETDTETEPNAEQEPL